MYELKISKIDFLKTVKNINQEICQQKQTKSKCLLTVLNWDRNLRNIFMSVAHIPLIIFTFVTLIKYTSPGLSEACIDKLRLKLPMSAGSGHIVTPCTSSPHPAKPFYCRVTE